MPRQLHRLSAATVKSLTEPGRHSDGGGLVLHIDGDKRKRWVWRFKWQSKVRDMGLGGFPTVSLADARQAAQEARRLLAKGLDPIAERQAQKAEEKPVTFQQAVDEFLETFNPSWRNPKHRAQWASTLATYCEDILSKPVAKIDTDDVLAILRPLWTSKAETASRVRGRIERVLSQAKARGWRTGENPALWRGHLDQLLPRPQKLTRGHHAAVAYADLPKLYNRLRAKDASAAHALRFLILTAARTSEVTGAVWSEIDLDARLWVVPAVRMKAKREHRVPLSDEAVAILRQMHDARTCEFVFTGTDKKGKPAGLSSMSMAMLLRRMKVDATVHGMRSAFRDWSAEATAHANEVAEAALAHVIENKVERAYRRGDLLERRRALMADWAGYVCGFTHT